MNCNYTLKNLEQVSMIADQADHIKSPLTELNYSVEILTSLSKIANLVLKKPIPLLLENVDFTRVWDMEFLPDGSFLVTQRTGRIIHYQKGSFKFLPNKIQVLYGDFSGLMGLAIDPEFEKNNYLYLYYTTSFDNSFSKKNFYVKSRISRFVLKDENLLEETILLDDIPGNKFHLGGRLEIGPDKKLYATTGDAIRNNVQNVSFLGGKILRINLDGAVPEDNPFEDSYVYSLGHRNPQGLAWNPKNDDLFSSEHGPWRYDEINVIKEGGNYGWPEMKCDELINNTINGKKEVPVKCFKNWTLGPSGAVFGDDKKNPWYGDLFVAGIRGNHLHRFKIENNKVMHDEVFYLSKDSYKGIMHPRLRDVEFYEGSLYVLSDVFGIAKITPTG
ncbi:PQQ-dependent sugar dehydrogenase [archaeon]|nr:PQQ-dependent sugar dehydrogenase [archaeon]